MVDADMEIDAEVKSEASNGEKRKREGKLQSKVWEHFTKLIKKDGTCDKSQCNHCRKLFNWSTRMGTTHLLCHISNGICPVFEQDMEKSPATSSHTRVNDSSLPCNYNPVPSQLPAQHPVGVKGELLLEGFSDLENQMADADKEIDVKANYQSEAGTGEEHKREGKLRSKVWEHFTKMIKEDGTCDKCQCNHCQKLFSWSNRTGTTHLLRHISGTCPVLKQDKKSPATLSQRRMNDSFHCKYNTVRSQLPAQHPIGVEGDLPPEDLSNLEHQTVDADKEVDVEANYQSEAASTAEKHKREGKLRSKVWEHFIKLVKEDGTCDKCQCNHCQKQFTWSTRIGTTHLLRHINNRACPVFKHDKENSPATLSHKKVNDFSFPCKYNPGPSQLPAQHPVGVEGDLLQEGLSDIDHQVIKEMQDDNGIQKLTPSHGKLPQKFALQSQTNGEELINELRIFLAKLAELTNVRSPTASLTPAAFRASDYSIASAVKCLNEVVDIPQSSEMYLDAFEILQDEGQRESFISLPLEPRRRWIQRILQRRYPLRYSSNIS